jgi:hypothetical protein
MPEKTSHPIKTYFGLAALVTGIISDLFLGANIGVSYLKISPGVFSQLNNLTALFFCILTPLTLVLGVLGYTRKNDSKTLSAIAVTLVMIPFLILFTRLILYFMRG